MGEQRAAAGSRGPSAGEKTQQGVAIASGLLLVGAAVVSTLLGVSVRGVADVSALAVGLTAALVFAAAMAIGAAAGFLFGLPRRRFTEQIEPATPAEAPAGAAATGAASTGAASSTGATLVGARTVVAQTVGNSFLANSNLIKVSDWVTTIVVGLGLVQLSRLGPAAARLQTALTEPLGGSASAGVIGLSIVTIGLLAGFLIVYLWTTIRVRELLEDSEIPRELVRTLQGRTLQEARVMMASAGLRLEAPHGIADEDLITVQAPEPGTLLPVGEAVVVEEFVQVARGAGPPPP